MSDEAARLIRGDWLPIYRERLDALWFQSVQLNSNLYLLEKISEFPVELFALDLRLFWSLAAQAFYESSIMTIGRILGDRRSDVLTLLRFRQDLIDHAADDDARNHLEQHLPVVPSEENLRETLKEVIRVRNEWIAHLRRRVIAAVDGGSPGMVIVPLGPLQAVRDAVNHLIDALALDVGKAHIYMDYSDLVQQPPGEGFRPDIDRILDQIVGASAALRMPEEQPQYWRGVWEDLSEHDRSQFNKHRARQGLQPYDG